MSGEAGHPFRSVAPRGRRQLPPLLDKRLEYDYEEGIDGSLNCHECGAQFYDETAFIAHMDAHGYKVISEANNSRPLAIPCPGYFAEWRGSWLHCSICSQPSTKLQQHLGHLAVKHPSIKVKFEFSCRHCKFERFCTESDRYSHEQACADMQLLRRREIAASAPCYCPWCSRRHGTSQDKLAAHILVEHSDILQKLREYCGSRVSEFLPFRCSSCLVGFEDARVLEHHWRARELLGIPCRGELLVYDYKQTMRRIKEDEITDLYYLSMADDQSEEDEDENESIPRDPPPFLPPLMDVHRLEKCKHCREMWPVGQMVLHVKNEHPYIYFQQSQLKCGKCKQVGFYSLLHYIDHWEICSSSSPAVPSSALTAVAPRHCPFRVKNAIPEMAENQIRQCRLCSVMLNSLELMLHMKEKHALRHFTDAPYTCLHCGDIAFYSHAEYKIHSVVCDGTRPSHLADDLYAVVLSESEMRENSEADFRAYRARFDDVRRMGTLTCLDRRQRCGKCTDTKSHWDSLRSLSMHMLADHFSLHNPIVCAGCGSGFRYVAALTDHAMKQNNQGNAQCFNMGRIFSNPAKAVGKINLVELRNSCNSNAANANGDSLLVAYWKKELQLERLASMQTPTENLSVAVQP